MSALTPERLDQIEKTASAATPGPWHWMQPGLDYYEVLNDETSIAIDMIKQADAEHIANMDPATTLELVAEVRQLRAEAVELHSTIELVRGIHTPEAATVGWEKRTYCQTCQIHLIGCTSDYERTSQAEWPCPTIKALGEEA